MKVLTGVLLLSFTLFTAACGGDPGPEGAPKGTGTTGGTSAPPAGVAASPVGVQVFEIEAGQMGFIPEEVTLEAGKPARFVFTRTVESDCASQIQIPAFGVEKTDLPLEVPVAVEFTPGEAGTFTFVCGMGMQEGTVVVRS